ncbi:MAG: 4-oxalocrotonate tautomerase family protein [Firmicutes bacterium]|nr:4-oxalocrotonate tautomerase family protein [Bacillota bacterium]
MPVVTVKMAKRKDIETKRKLADEITRVMVSVLSVRPEWVTVLIEEFARENRATGGNLHIDRFGTGYGRNGFDEGS